MTGSSTAELMILFFRGNVYFLLNPDKYTNSNLIVHFTNIYALIKLNSDKIPIADLRGSG